MKALVIGDGEVGKSLQQVLGCDVRGKKEREDREGYFDIIHICFPYFEGFVEEVKKYQKQYKPKYTVIHSTVPIGTSKKLKAYHSPVRGMHPDMEESMKTFVTYLAPHNEELKSYFKSKGMKIEMLVNAKDTEALKLLDTTYYFWNIIFEKAVYEFCQQRGLDFSSIYTHANETYNDGYLMMGKDNVRRPVLKHIQGSVGGHCLVPNAEILSEEHGFDLTKILLTMNKSL